MGLGVNGGYWASGVAEYCTCCRVYSAGFRVILFAFVNYDLYFSVLYVWY